MSNESLSMHDLHRGLRKPKTNIVYVPGGEESSLLQVMAGMLSVSLTFIVPYIFLLVSIRISCHNQPRKFL